ncbi:MAG TPA: isoprenylcysteine carboxylmethyltransferase family protein [Phenylobacterium sp.]|jgi:protein-S-isoprenylcysteine O-methyltransferase Ste14
MPVGRLIPLALVAMLFCMELYASRLRRTEAETRDRGSLLALWGLVGLSYGVAFNLWSLRHPPGPIFGEWALWVGAAAALCGMALRVWSVATLGRYFTYVVKVAEDQPVVETGPYRLLRHPSYAGALLTALGIGLSLRVAIAPVILVAAQLLAYSIRMSVEEKALSEGIGEPYRAYMRRTKRIVPYVW